MWRLKCAKPTGKSFLCISLFPLSLWKSKISPSWNFSLKVAYIHRQMDIEHFSKIFKRICWIFFKNVMGVECFTFITATPYLVYLYICYSFYCNHSINNGARISGLFVISLKLSLITAHKCNISVKPYLEPNITEHLAISYFLTNMFICISVHWHQHKKMFLYVNMSCV